MSESKHTPEPWHAPHFADDNCTCDCKSIVSECYAGAICTMDIGNGFPIGEGGNDAPPLEEAKANALRIVACVNACAGIPTEALEAGVVGEMVELLKKFSAEADQWADTVSDDYRSPCIEPGAKAAHPGSETVFTIGDLRDASAVLAKLGGAS